MACREVIPHMRKRGGGHILLFSPPVEIDLLPGKVAYFISKFGMTMIAHGLAPEVRADNIAVNALWPATLIESQATINHRLGTPDMWRKASIMSDAVLAVLAGDASEMTGRALLDEEVLRDAGVTDFEPYNCVPGGKPAYLVGEEGASTWRDAKHRLSE